MLVEETRSFLPTTLSEWLGVFVLISGAIGAVWLFAWRPIMDKIALQAVQISGHEKEITASEARIEATERAHQLLHLDVGNLRESVTRMSVEMQTLINLTRDGAVSRAEELGEIRERLVRIETKVERKWTGS